jgi:hypothetical protein
MRIGETLDAAIKLYRAHWKTLMGIAAFILVPVNFLQSFLTRNVATSNPFNLSSRPPTLPENSDYVATISAVFAIGLFLFIQPFLAAAFARAASDVYMGAKPTIGGVYRFALSRTHSILWVTFLSALAVLGGFILLIVPGILFAIRFGFSPVVVAVEGARGTRAMRRSWRLAKGHFWKILGTLFLAGILSNVVAGILTLPFTISGIALGSNGWFLRWIGASIAAVIARPYAAMVGVLLYFDMRVRKEGLDLALMARELERPGP